MPLDISSAPKTAIEVKDEKRMAKYSDRNLLISETEKLPRIISIVWGFSERSRRHRITLNSKYVAVGLPQLRRYSIIGL